MAREKSTPRDRSRKKPIPQARAGERDRRPTEEEFQGPPPREATMMRSDREREAGREAAEFRERDGCVKVVLSA